MSKHIVAVFVVLGFASATPVSADLDPVTQALVAAGDVDGVAASLAGIHQNDPTALVAAMQDVAAANPAIAGAVLNATTVPQAI